jgi:hypothetical protein
MVDAYTNLAPVPRVVVVDTTELRWFGDGRLPPGVAAWFTKDGEVGEREERCDIYRLDRRDIGVKLRARRTLELKIRQSVGERLAVGAGLMGRVEAWRKWSPADSLVERNDDLAWVDVHKTVIKRRFCVDGDECISAEEAALLTAGGVDVEVVAVIVEGVEAWTFAFAAFGPRASRRTAIVSASQALFADKRVPELGFLSGRSGGYPNWLVQGASPRPTSQNPWRPQVLPAPIGP